MSISNLPVCWWTDCRVPHWERRPPSCRTPPKSTNIRVDRRWKPFLDPHLMARAVAAACLRLTLPAAALPSRTPRRTLPAAAIHLLPRRHTPPARALQHRLHRPGAVANPPRHFHRPPIVAAHHRRPRLLSPSCSSCVVFSSLASQI